MAHGWPLEKPKEPAETAKGCSALQATAVSNVYQLRGNESRLIYPLSISPDMTGKFKLTSTFPVSMLYYNI